MYGQGGGHREPPLHQEDQVIDRYIDKEIDRYIVWSNDRRGSLQVNGDEQNHVQRNSDFSFDAFLKNSCEFFDNDKLPIFFICI